MVPYSLKFSQILRVRERTRKISGSGIWQNCEIFYPQKFYAIRYVHIGLISKIIILPYLLDRKPGLIFEQIRYIHNELNVDSHTHAISLAGQPLPSQRVRVRYGDNTRVVLFPRNPGEHEHANFAATA